jgi:nucleotide-binding universal stress UspA family protein
MPRHILIPTDGSRVSARGIKAGVELAQDIGARVTAVYVIPPWQPALDFEGGRVAANSTLSAYKQQTQKAAREALAAVKIAAEISRVPCTTKAVHAGRPWEGILRTARALRCDLIAMGSHGRGGLAGLFLGSETQRVLANSRIPVLVIR